MSTTPTLSVRAIAYILGILATVALVGLWRYDHAIEPYAVGVALMLAAAVLAPWLVNLFTILGTIGVVALWVYPVHWPVFAAGFLLMWLAALAITIVRIVDAAAQRLAAPEPDREA